MARFLALLPGSLALLPLLVLGACQSDPEPVVHAKTFVGKIDSAKFGEAWELLTDDDKLVMGKEEFIGALTDAMRVPGFDSIMEWRVVRQSGDTSIVGTLRMAPDWNRLETIKSSLNRREQLANLRENGNMPWSTDSSRVVTVIKTPAGPRFHLGLAGLKAWHAARDSISQSFVKKIKVQLTSGIVENNFQAFFHVDGKVTSTADLDLGPVGINVFLNGKHAGTITLKGKQKVPAKGTFSGEMSAYYEGDLTPQKFGTSWDKGRGAVRLSAGSMRTEVVSAVPVDRRDLDRLILRAMGGVQPPVVF